ncbi:MAG: hypothetical protein AAFU65_11380 [Pseudomonadota bacterium]
MKDPKFDLPAFFVGFVLYFALAWLLMRLAMRPLARGLWLFGDSPRFSEIYLYVGLMAVPGLVGILGGVRTATNRVARYPGGIRSRPVLLSTRALLDVIFWLALAGLVVGVGYVSWQSWQRLS